MLLLLLFVAILHRHDGSHGISDILAATMRHYPLMRIVCNNILSSLAADGWSACRSHRFTVFCYDL